MLGCVMSHRLLCGPWLLVCVCLAGAALPAQTQKNPPTARKLIRLPLSDDFIRTVEKVVQASEKKFEGIKGPAILGLDFTDAPIRHLYRWRTSEPLPGSDECYMAQMESAYIKRPHYFCRFYPVANSETDLVNAIASTIQAVLGPGYVVNPGRGNSGSVRLFCIPTFKTMGACLTEERALVGLYSSPGDPSKSQIQVTIDEPAPGPLGDPQQGQTTGGRVEGLPAPLPPARLTGRRATADGLAANVIVNRTPYELNLEFDGSEHHRILIAPGATRTITFSPGVYVITGRLAKQTVVPFKGTHTYAGDSEYRTEFYLQ